MNEFSHAFNPEAPLMKEVVEVKRAPSQPQINPLLLAETEKLNAGKIIDVAELDKPLF